MNGKLTLATNRKLANSEHRGFGHVTEHLQTNKHRFKNQQATRSGIHHGIKMFVFERLFGTGVISAILSFKYSQSRSISSEEDLQHLQRDIVETPVTQIIEHLQSVDDVRNEFDLAEGIEFDNHLNALSDDAKEFTQRLELQSLQPFTPRRPSLSKPWLRPNQICVYTTVEGLRKAAFIVGYKAPHKLTLAMLRQVLHHGCHTMDLESVISRVWVPSAKDTVAHFEYHAELLVAAILAQTFSYIVRSGTQYGYITTEQDPLTRSHILCPMCLSNKTHRDHYFEKNNNIVFAMSSL